MIPFFSVEEALAVVVGAVVVGVAVVTSVVGAAAVSAVFFSPFPQAATIKADRSVTELNTILFFIKIILLKGITLINFIIFNYCPGVFAFKPQDCSKTGLNDLTMSSVPSIETT